MVLERVWVSAWVIPKSDDLTTLFYSDRATQNSEVAGIPLTAPLPLPSLFAPLAAHSPHLCLTSNN